MFWTKYISLLVQKVRKKKKKKELAVTKQENFVLPDAWSAWSNNVRQMLNAVNKSAQSYWVYHLFLVTLIKRKGWKYLKS